MLTEGSIAIPNIQKCDLFLAPYISKTNRRNKSFNKNWKYKRPYIA